MEAVLGSVELLSPEIRKEQYFNAEEQKESQKAYSEMLGRIRRWAKIRCGEMDPSFYEREEVIEAIKKALECHGAKIDVIFGKQAKDSDEAKETFKAENPNWWKLHQNYPAQLLLCWSAKRPETHYTIVDGREAFVEERHKKDELRATLFRSDAAFSKALEKRFDDALSTLSNGSSACKL